ncbi:MAG: hypothetical protein VB876_10780, partial [Pirellulales bacterium]
MTRPKQGRGDHLGTVRFPKSRGSLACYAVGTIHPFAYSVGFTVSTNGCGSPPIADRMSPAC